MSLLVTALVTAAAQAVPQEITVAAAGDVACSPDSDPNFNGGLGTEANCRMLATSDLILERGAQAVLVPGDLQYSTGRLAAFRASYDKSWGRFKAITYPVPGSHEYQTAGAADYYRYFGEQAGDPAKGYYSFDLGKWHVVALNFNCDEVGGCGVDSAQGRWLEADLNAHPSACILAYWHNPRFSSGKYGSNAAYQDFWRILYQAGADIVLSGHEHNYERFAPQRPDGTKDAESGIREFVVGTGGVALRPLQERQPNSEASFSEFGVLFLNLSDSAYRWEFVTPAGQTLDSGTGSCQ